MPYQNNNNRVNPNATGKYKINPVARPVDKQIKYQPDLSSANRTAGIGNALAQLGQGIYDFGESDWMKKRAEEEAILLHIGDVEAGNNTHLWNEAQKRVKGIQRFNPHLKDNYMTLAAQEFTKKAIGDLLSMPDFYKHSNDEVVRHIQTQKDNLVKQMKEAGLSNSAVVGCLKEFEAYSDNYYAQYIDKNAQYTHDLSYGMIASNLTSTLRNSVYEGRKGQYDKFKDGLNTEITNALQNGGTAEDILQKVVAPAITSVIKQAASDPNAQFEFSDLMKAVREIEVGGMKLSALSPDYEYNLRQQYYEAMRQQTVEEDLVYQRERKVQERNSFHATRDFYEWLSQNPDINPNEAYAKAQELGQQYGAYELLPSFMSNIQSTRDLMYSLNNTKDDPETVMDLNLALAADNLTPSMVYEAVQNRKLSAHTTFSYLDRMKKAEEAEKVAEIKAGQTQYKALGKQLEGMFKDVKFITDYNKAVKKDGKLLSSQEIKEEIVDIHNQVVNGEMTTTEANKRLNDLYNQMTKKVSNQRALSNQTAANFNPTKIIQSSYFKNIPINVKGNKEQVTAALTKMNLTRGKVPTIVSSMPSSKRTVNGVTKSHKGTDLAMSIGTPLYLPQGMTGEVVATGFNGSNATFKTNPKTGKVDIGSGLGNYMIIKLSNGYYMRVCHLKNMNLKSGQFIDYNTVYATSGMTGRCTGAHLDIQFWTPDGKEVIDPYDFAKRVGIKIKEK